MLFMFELVLLGEEEPDWPVFQNTPSTIGHSNGDHDLVRTVLEVCVESIYFLQMLVIRLIYYDTV